jgi:RNA polymerase sigma-70 factor (ECF subfamily)
MAEGRSTAAGGPPRPDGAEEQAIRHLVERGDPSAFDLLVRTYQADLTRLAYRLLGWSDEAEDVVQEAFLAVLNNLDKFRGQSRLSTWVTTITVNKCRSHLRRRWLRLDVLRRRRAGTTPPAERSAEADLMDKERFAAVRRAVQRLPAALREVVVLRYLEQMPAEEICRVLNVSQKVLNVRLHRARSRLKDLLAGVAED